MALEILEYEDGHADVKITVCPACGYEFAENESRPRHYRDDHDPEDFGLSRIGKRPEGVNEPLFVPVEELPMPTTATEPRLTEPVPVRTGPVTGGGASDD